MDISALVSFAKALQPPPRPQNTILTGTIVSNTDSGYSVRGSYTTADDTGVHASNVPSAGNSNQTGAGVLMLSPGGDGQDMTVLGISGYYYTR